MTDDEIAARYATAQQELRRFEANLALIQKIFLGIFIFGVSGLFILRVIS